MKKAFFFIAIAFTLAFCSPNKKGGKVEEGPYKLVWVCDSVQTTYTGKRWNGRSDDQRMDVITVCLKEHLDTVWMDK